MKKNTKTFIFSLILACFAVITIRQMWQNVFTDILAVIVLVVTIVLVVKDIRGGK
ncbi:hypothetical protein JC777_00885 [Bacillus cytotoxicus]|uniref:hypothetical protein n=1 Tax=Bacillus cytotoxicus TaxID=580165 RepID=UPI001593B735|nr:hypothetical protein [Bacillus cytotoxicus]QTR83174.1 hypothetical protein JC777_00885 [Bacillus cytotoxicus]QTR86911.1 hypothetical protein JC774_20900 [Bacillus cytotoxicus]